MTDVLIHAITVLVGASLLAIPLYDIASHYINKG
jgi:hypothetical protein